MLDIEKPLFLHEHGKRPYNQDYVFPEGQKTSSDQQLFLVCDGVGGSQRGDVASKLVCQYFPEFFSKFKTEKINQAFLDKALGYTLEKLNAYALQHPDTERMQTTMTLLHIDHSGCTIAWIGDSRVYHISKGKIKFQTTDHSFVQSLVSQGAITEQEARTHPQKNLITRAISLGNEPIKTDTHFIPVEQILNGDYFFLCTDGVVESVTNELLSKYMDGTVSNDYIVQAIKRYCLDSSQDNFSCYLIRIKKKKEDSTFHGNVKVDNIPQTAKLPTPPVVQPTEKKSDTEKQKKFGKKLWLIPVGIILIGVLLIPIFRDKNIHPSEKSIHQNEMENKDGTMKSSNSKKENNSSTLTEEQEFDNKLREAKLKLEDANSKRMTPSAKSYFENALAAYKDSKEFLSNMDGMDDKKKDSLINRIIDVKIVQIEGELNAIKDTQKRVTN